MKRRVKFTFPHNFITEPVIFRLGQKFEVIPNIRRADVGENTGWVVLELEGAEENIQKGMEWVISLGVRVDPVVGDVLEG